MNIILTGDAQRPIPGQSGNINWISDLFSYQIEAVTGVKPKVITTDELLDVEDWINTYRDLDHPAWLLNSDLFKDFTIVIGFELPTNLVFQMRRKNIKFLDINVHPVRFLDDLVFSLDINGLNPPQCEIGDDTFFVHANLMKSFYSRNLPEIPESSCVIIGQTKIDRSLISSNGKIFSLYDFEKEIRKLKDNHTVLFKPHPHNRDDELIQWVKKFDIELIEENIYSLLSHPNLKMLCGISSSVLYEARYFGKGAVFWGLGRNHPNPIVSTDMLKMGFWKNLLSGSVNINNVPEIYLPQKENRMRLSCRSFWGYPFGATDGG